MKDTFRFRDFPVYQEARKFRQELKQLTQKCFPKEETFILRSQLWRSLDSILLNVAEGSERYTDKDFSHFLNISVGSVSEVVAWLDCALDDNYVTIHEHQQ